MPEFTYEESDNYMAAQEARGMTDAKLLDELNKLKKDIQSGVAYQYNYRLWLNTLEAEINKRGLLKEPLTKKVRQKLSDEEKKERRKFRKEKKRVKDLYALPKIKPTLAQEEVRTAWAEKQARKMDRAKNIVAGVDGGSVSRLTRWSWIIKSGATRGGHIVEEPDKGTLVCDCHDYQKYQGKVKCKHIMAVELLEGRVT